MEEAIKEYTGWIIGIVAVVIVGLIIYKIYKFHKLIELDKLYKKYNNEGILIQEARTRNIWDYHFFPGFSRLWHASEWQTAVVMAVLVVLFVIYLFTKDDKLFNLLGVNFGLVLGMMIKNRIK
jgi:uncharacterized integral membrane protein